MLLSHKRGMVVGTYKLAMIFFSNGIYNFCSSAGKPTAVRLPHHLMNAFVLCKPVHPLLSFADWGCDDIRFESQLDKRKPGPKKTFRRLQVHFILY